MFRHILVPLDGSPRAEQTLPIAAHIAHTTGGTLTLLRIVPDMEHVDADSVPVPLDVNLEADIATAKDYLMQLVAADEQGLFDGMGIKTEVLIGSPAQEILTFAQTQQVDLITLCSHGRTGFKRWLLGSVAQMIARYSPVPVLVLREGGPSPLARPNTLARPLRVLVALDGSPYAEKVVVPAAQLCAALAAPAQGTLHLAVVLRRLRGIYDHKETIAAIRALALSDARTYLNDMERRLREPDLAPLNLGVTSSIVIKEDVADTLLKVAESGKDVEDIEGFDGCDIIALATHGRSGLTRLTMGSVTERILGATMLPLLIVRPSEPVTETQESATEKEQAKDETLDEYHLRVGLI
jgi:nucleotide-binding universal stress UspA family protein